MDQYDVGVAATPDQLRADEIAAGVSEGLLVVHMRKRTQAAWCKRCKGTVRTGSLGYHLINTADGCYEAVYCRECWDMLRERMPPDIQL